MCRVVVLFVPLLTPLIGMSPDILDKKIQCSRARIDLSGKKIAFLVKL